jgi:hypothetical protein
LFSPNYNIALRVKKRSWNSFKIEARKRRGEQKVPRKELRRRRGKGKNEKMAVFV